MLCALITIIAVLCSCVSLSRLEVWPGYVTAIADYEGGVMLLTDVSHRVLRTETVLDIMLVISHLLFNTCNFSYYLAVTVKGFVCLQPEAYSSK